MIDSLEIEASSQIKMIKCRRIRLLERLETFGLGQTLALNSGQSTQKTFFAIYGQNKIFGMQYASR